MKRIAENLIAPAGRCSLHFSLCIALLAGQVSAADQQQPASAGRQPKLLPRSEAEVRGTLKPVRPRPDTSRRQWTQPGLPAAPAKPVASPTSRLRGATYPATPTGHQRPTSLGRSAFDSSWVTQAQALTPLKKETPAAGAIPNRLRTSVESPSRSESENTESPARPWNQLRREAPPQPVEKRAEPQSKSDAADDRTPTHSTEASPAPLPSDANEAAATPSPLQPLREEGAATTISSSAAAPGEAEDGVPTPAVNWTITDQQQLAEAKCVMQLFGTLGVKPTEGDAPSLAEPTPVDRPDSDSDLRVTEWQLPTPARGEKATVSDTSNAEAVADEENPVDEDLAAVESEAEPEAEVSPGSFVVNLLREAQQRLPLRTNPFSRKRPASPQETAVSRSPGESSESNTAATDESGVQDSGDSLATTEVETAADALRADRVESMTAGDRDSDFVPTFVIGDQKKETPAVDPWSLPSPTDATHESPSPPGGVTATAADDRAPSFPLANTNLSNTIRSAKQFPPTVDESYPLPPSPNQPLIREIVEAAATPAESKAADEQKEVAPEDTPSGRDLRRRLISAIDQQVGDRSGSADPAAVEPNIEIELPQPATQLPATEIGTLAEQQGDSVDAASTEVVDGDRVDDETAEKQLAENGVDTASDSPDTQPAPSAVTSVVPPTVPKPENDPGMQSETSVAEGIPFGPNPLDRATASPAGDSRLATSPPAAKPKRAEARPVVKPSPQIAREATGQWQPPIAPPADPRREQLPTVTRNVPPARQPARRSGEFYQIQSDAPPQGPQGRMSTFAEQRATVPTSTNTVRPPLPRRSIAQSQARPPERRISTGRPQKLPLQVNEITTGLTVPPARTEPRRPQANPLPTPELRLAVRSSFPLQAPGRVRRASVVDRSVCEVVKHSPYELAVVGKRAGTTDVAIWLEGKESAEIYRVVVGYEETAASEQAKLERLLAELFPRSRITITQGEGSVRVQGIAKDRQEAIQIMSVVRSVKLIPVVDNLQVLRR